MRPDYIVIISLISMSGCERSSDYKELPPAQAREKFETTYKVENKRLLGAVIDTVTKACPLFRSESDVYQALADGEHGSSDSMEMIWKLREKCSSDFDSYAVGKLASSDKSVDQKMVWFMGVSIAAECHGIDPMGVVAKLDAVGDDFSDSTMAALDGALHDDCGAAVMARAKARVKSLK